MIDIHSHILPNVDDGSDSAEMSMTMIREAAAIGVSDLFLTPHYMRWRNYLSPAAKNKEIFDKLTKSVDIEKIPIRLHLGNEIYYSLEILDALRKGIIIPMGRSQKVLIEFSLIEEEEDITEAIHNIIALGYVPIVAHLERYPYISRTKDYEIIKHMGAMIQVNASSVVRRANKGAHRKAMSLIKSGLVDFIASDQHVPGRNYLKEAYAIVEKKFGSSMASVLFNNRSILQ